jgi:hypothetical protein
MRTSRHRCSGAAGARAMRPRLALAVGPDRAARDGYVCVGCQYSVSLAGTGRAHPSQLGRAGGLAVYNDLTIGCYHPGRSLGGADRRSPARADAPPRRRSFR